MNKSRVVRRLFPGFTVVRDPRTGREVLEVSTGGSQLCGSPLFNKGSAFSEEERDTLNLRGLLPPRVSSMYDQAERVLYNFRNWNDNLQRFIHLTAVLDRNETLYYRILHDHLEEMLPIVYTPTVGQACQQFGRIYRSARGLYIRSDQWRSVDRILANWTAEDVRIIVVTDGERILGLGDLGAGGMGIPIGKLGLYVVAAGFHPAQTLPVCLDVGTNNESLLKDPLYMGQRHHRLRGRPYDRLIESFMRAVKRRWPRAVVQFEDFAVGNSFRLLDRYRRRYACFNDDIQGTGAVALAAILGGLHLGGARLDDQRVVIAGAGSAGVGIARQIRAASRKTAVWLLNSKGIVTPDKATDPQRPFARPERGGLLETCRRVKPTILVGAAGRRGLFTRAILRTMAGPRPIVLPLSNPTSHAECTPKQAREWTRGRALVASGSPFPGTAQCNNVYIFPGVGLGMLSSGKRRVTDSMFIAAARAVADLAQDDLLPPLSEIRKVSAAVARAVGGRHPERHMWTPKYYPYRRGRGYSVSRGR